MSAPLPSEGGKDLGRRRKKKEKKREDRQMEWRKERGGPKNWEKKNKATKGESGPLFPS